MRRSISGVNRTVRRPGRRGCETTGVGVGVPGPRPSAKEASERILTPFLPQAIGRRIGSFLGSAAAGPRAAVLFTILAGAKRHRLEPWAYLRDVVLRLCAGETDLESLLPDRCAASHTEPVLQYRLDESRRKAARQKEARQKRRAAARKPE